MIEEQHPMQIGLFSMDIKCQQQQQQQQQHPPQQQQHPLQQQATTIANNLLPNGNERMLTTSTTTTTMAAGINGFATVDKMANNMAASSTTTTTTTATTTMPVTGKHVNGSCNDNHNSNSHTNTNKTNSNNNSNNNHNNNNNNCIHACGPGPPVSCSQHQLPITMTSVSGRVTLAECNLNSITAGHIGTFCTNSTYPNNNNNSNNSSSNYALQLPAATLGPPTLSLPVAQSASPLTPTAPLQQHPAAILTASATPATLCLSMAPTGHPMSNLMPHLHQQQQHQQQEQEQQHQQHCGLCCQPICDRYIMRVVDTSFHEGCLKCATCSLHLVHSCFARDGKLFCRIDYERMYLRNRCLGCGHKIAADELVMRTLENVFHLKCFACVVCGALLKKGEQYVVKQGQLFCRFDYEKEVEMLQGYDFYSDDLFPPKMDGRRGPKRPRTILNTQQRRAFKASFEVSPKPCRKVRENLAKETGLSLRIVQVWFQNQRAKVKKIQKKAKQEPQIKGTSDSQDSQESQDSNVTKVKDEAHSDSESQMDAPLFSANSDSIAKLRCIKDEHENAPFNCMETNKENCNKTNEPILNTILGLSYATFQQLMGPFTQTPMINPIDRLYSMQNSYFRPDELGYDECGKEAMEH